MIKTNLPGQEKQGRLHTPQISLSLRDKFDCNSRVALLAPGATCFVTRSNESYNT